MTDQTTGTESEAKTFESFDSFLAEQPDNVKALYEANVNGLKSALESERESRKKLTEQVKSLSPQVEKGSELERKLEETSKMLREAEQREAEISKRAKFTEGAIRPGVNCTNVKAAYAFANAEGLFSEQGEPDWKKLKELAPELFRSTVVTKAGASGKTAGDDINSALRKAAGY